MPQHSPQYYEEKKGNYNQKFLEKLRQLASYRKDIVILMDEKDRILNIITASKMLSYYSDCIKAAAGDVQMLPQDYIPGFEKLFNMESELGYNLKFSKRLDDYIDDCKVVLNEIKNILDEYGETVKQIKSDALTNMNNVNVVHQEYCYDYGYEYSPIYKDSFIDEYTGGVIDGSY